ncbi:MAG: pyridoxamine 5'-phosphate oxidase family protein [Chloroflexota bacterium]
MPSGYGIAESIEGAIEWSEVVRHLEQARNYWVSTSSLDAAPHAMPVWGLWYDGAFHFCTDPASRKARNLRQNPRIVVHLESGDDVVILHAVAHEITDPDQLTDLVNRYHAKYEVRPELSGPESGTYRAAPDTVLSWHERDFPASATRWYRR